MPFSYIVVGIVFRTCDEDQCVTGSYLLMSIVPPGTGAVDHSSPKSFVLNFYFNLLPGVYCHLSVCLEIPSPRVPWTTPFSSSLWVPCQGLPGDR